MKKSRIAAFAIGLFAIILVGAFVGVATAPIAPKAQTVEKAIPDDKIPH